MSAMHYTRYEIKRTFRNVRFWPAIVGFPLVLYIFQATSNGNQKVLGVPSNVYQMSGMAAWGAMGAILAIGGGVAAERQIGWNRQLHITPLPSSAYFTAKVAAGYTLAVLTIGLLYIAGTIMGVRLSAAAWFTTTLLLLLGLVPLAAMGIAIGHRITAESTGPVLGGLTTLLAFLGGAFVPIGQHGILHYVVELLPSYWLVQAGRVASGGNAWPIKGWLVILTWSVVMSRLAFAARGRDTAKI
jgi:ABC-2 type transport system permease protein